MQQELKSRCVVLDNIGASVYQLSQQATKNYCNEEMRSDFEQANSLISEARQLLEKHIQ